MKIFSLLLIVSLPFFCVAESSEQKSVVRLEDEITLAVQPNDTEPLWKFLKQSFKGGATIGDMRFQTVESVEHFVDTYFDTADRKLTKQWAGLRFRHRIGERGEIKELIQLKVTPSLTNKDLPAELRNEIKFKPAIGVGGNGDFPRSSLLTSFLKTRDLPHFNQVLNSLGVSPEALSYLLTIKQERRRIYFRQGDKQFFTVTLDIFDGKKGWLDQRLTQIEVEIGENLYTGSSEAERDKYIGMQAELRSLIAKKFHLEVNQTPKVIQMYELLSNKGIISNVFMKFDQRSIFFLLLPLFIALYIFTKRENARA